MIVVWLSGWGTIWVPPSVLVPLYPTHFSALLGEGAKHRYLLSEACWDMPKGKVIVALTCRGKCLPHFSGKPLRCVTGECIAPARGQEAPCPWTTTRCLTPSLPALGWMVFTFSFKHSKVNMRVCLERVNPCIVYSGFRLACVVPGIILAIICFLWI